MSLVLFLQFCITLSRNHWIQKYLKREVFWLRRICSILKNTIHTGWVKKSCDLQLSCMVYFQYFLKICIFFWYSNDPKKNREPFPLSKSKLHKSKNVYINYLYRNLKFHKDWITESEIIGKIVIRKFAIFSSGLIFKEKLLKFSSSFLLSIF